MEARRLRPGWWLEADNPLGACVASCKPIKVDNIYADKRFQKSRVFVGKGTLGRARSQICCPVLVSEGRPLAVLLCVNRVTFDGAQSGVPFLPEDLTKAAITTSVLEQDLAYFELRWQRFTAAKMLHARAQNFLEKFRAASSSQKAMKELE